MLNYDILFEESSIEQIAAGLAHEVKNPLSLVRANIDLLELNDTNHEYAKNYKVMRREIDKVNDLLLDFIQYAKPIENNLCNVSVSHMLCDIIDTLKTAYDKRIEFELSCGESDCIIQADEGKIRRVFANLLKNAIEAISDDGKISIKIKETKSHAIIRVSDNGIGLTGEEIARLSQPFYSTKSNGSGLGLYITKTIIKEHNGTFKLTGEKLKGCTATVKLPKSQDA